MRALKSARRRWLPWAALSATILVSAVLVPWYWRSVAAPAAAVSKTQSVADELSLYQLTSTWTTDDNRSLKLNELRGSLQILALIFTRCSGTCPLTVKELQKFAASLPEPLARDTHFVLVTFDPTDTAEILLGYRKTMHLNGRWLLLRSAPGAVRELAATLGFSYQPQGDQFVHSNLVTVLSRKGVIVHQQAGAGGSASELLSALQLAQSE